MTRTKQLIVAGAVVVVAAGLGVGVAVASSGGDSAGSAGSTTTTTAPAKGPGAGASATPRPGKEGRRLVVQAATGAAAQALGTTPDELRTAVRGGQTLAQIAQAKGIDPAAVADAVRTAGTGAVQKAVTAGTIDQTVADRITQRLPQLVDRFVNQTGSMLRGKASSGTSPTTVPAPAQQS